MKETTVVPVVLLVILLTISDIDGLKNVAAIIPKAVTVGDTVTLQCQYDLETDPLYTVKWYKGRKEFFRYIPKELPHTKVFPVTGIDVDMSKSGANEVVLRDVKSDVGGFYKCEVSADAPTFHTVQRYGYMHVVHIPDGQPQMSIEKDTYEVGYTLRGNCTSPLSMPVTNLTWILNGKRINESFRTDRNESVPEGQRPRVMRTIGLEQEIDTNTFQGGKARLQCVATLFHLYRSVVETVLEEERPRPRPSSVLGTRDTSTGSASGWGRWLLAGSVLLALSSR